MTVTPVNDPPVITGQVSLSVNEDLPLTLVVANFTITDADNPAGPFTLNVQNGTNYTRSGNTITPAANYNGTLTVPVTVSDPGGAVSGVFNASVTITPVNDPPVVTSTPPTTASAGLLYTYTMTATDVDAGNVLTYSGTTIPGWLTFNAGTHVLSGTPALSDVGTHNVLLSVSDGTASVDQSFTITVGNVNTAPDVTNIPNQSIIEGSAFATINLDNYVSDAETPDAGITWSYSGNNHLSVSIVNRVATIAVPDGDWYGNETITFTARDNDAVNPLTDADAATFTVNPVNDAPVVSNIPDQTIEEGAAFAVISLDNYVYDAETPDASLTWTYSGNVRLSVSIVNRVATITAPNEDWFGNETITFTARDNDPSNALSGSDAVIFTITPVNDIPDVSVIPGQTIPEGGSFTPIHLDDYVWDVDNSDEEITWTYSGNTDLRVSIVNRVATITPPDENWFGSEDITFRASDGEDVLILKCASTATFTVTPVNDAPVVGDIPNQTITEGEHFATINLNNYVSDLETPDNAITWTHSGSGSMTVTITNNIATIAFPNSNWNGSSTITFEARDNDGSNPLTDSDAAVFTITAVNDAPLISNIPSQGINEGESFAVIRLDDYVSDVESPDSRITWSYSGNSSLTVSIVNRVASITTPNSHWTGSETITFTATDDDATHPLSVSDPATFTVTNVNDSPVITEIADQVTFEGTSFVSVNLDDHVTDLETADANIVWTYSGNSDLTVSINNHVVTVGIPDVNWFGSETIVFTATDNDAGMPLSASDAVVFTVLNVNDPPVISGQNVISNPEDQVLSIQLSNLVVSDVDNLPLDLSVVVLPGDHYTIEGDNSLIPDKDFNGSLTVNLVIYDLSIPSNSFAALATITGVNDRPAMVSIPDQSIKQDSVFSNINLDDYIEDIETPDDLITWSYTGDKELTVSMVNRIVTITAPDAGWIGSDTIVFTAMDDDALVPLSITDTVIFTVTRKINTGLIENELVKVMVYPNPTQGMVTLQFEGQQDREIIITIHSVKGELIRNSKNRIIDNRLDLDLQHLTSGTYFIRLISGDKTRIFTIVKN